jgi:CBS domain containing-hemolysin-like protein
MPDSGLPVGEMIGIAVCLVAIAFFSASETALTTITRSRAEVLANQNPGRFQILGVWSAHKKRIVATLLVLNTIANVLCPILGYRVALHFLPDYAEAISAFGLTLVILAFAEITPKGIALHNAERIVVPLLRIVLVFDFLLRPLSWLLSRIPGLITGRWADHDDAEVPTEDEIEFHIRRGVDQEVFEEKGQGELLMSAMQFPDTMVRDVMIPRTDICGIDRRTPLAEVAQTLIEAGHSRVPVYDANLDHVIGLLYAKDVLRQIHRRTGSVEVSAGDLVRGEPMFAPETQKISALLADMRRRGMHMAVVVDEFGGTAGLITLEDIIEELVGEIRDEFDPEEPLIQKTDEGRWQVDARVSIHDLRDQTGIGVPDTGDYASIGGFAVAHVGRIPRRGKVLDYGEHEIIVVDADARHVKRLEIRRKGGAKPGAGGGPAA